MQFSDISLVLQIVTALVSSWISLLVIWALAIEIFSSPRAVRRARTLRAFATLGPAWLIVQGYVIAIAKWFGTQNSISWVGLAELIWALTPGLNLLYAYDWGLELIAFMAAFFAALFRIWGG